MCDPATLAIAGAVTSTLGTVQSAMAANANAKFQQQIALDNANRTSEQMRDAQERGTDAEQQVLTDGAYQVANTRAALASNNMDLTHGSPLDTILNTTVSVQRDAYRTRQNTRREVDDLEVERYNYLNNASARGAEASNATSSGFVAGVGTALSGASNVYRARAAIA